jgi:hypothetical protein
MGKQSGVFTVVAADDGSFTGSIVDDMGTMEVLDGKIDGNALTWKMNMTVPVPMELTCEATVDGDALTGKVHAGAFGVMALEGTRRN